ncbi:hypothetical protein VTP01DRAFT_4981 [Rhizomucor pusillus]|uniref:uncharacterized protein n=1 Tax=Rhizomucor pusillus TaxID=4840 RepID=UPI003742FC8E
MYLDHKSSPKRSIIDSEEEQIQAKEERDDTFKQDEVPEGGFGWFVVLGAFISQFMTFGISTACFTGTICLICTNCTSMGQILASYVGVTWAMTIGSLLMTSGLIFASFSTEVWHLYLTQGILFGLGSSICYIVRSTLRSTSIFRAEAWLGIFTSGTGVGGLILPFIIDSINQRLGGAWTYRILGFICLTGNGLANLLVGERVPRSIQKKKFSDIIQLEILKDVNYDIWCLIACLQVMGYYLPYFYLPYEFRQSSDGSALISVASTANIVGRVLAGILADRIGHLTTNMLFCFFCGLSSFLIWTFADSYGTLMAFSAVFGMMAASYSPLISPIIASIVGMEKIGIRFISDAFVYDAEPFLTYKICIGVAYIFSSLTALALKFKIKHSIFAKF